jgi:hypothetical protein
VVYLLGSRQAGAGRARVVTIPPGRRPTLARERNAGSAEGAFLGSTFIEEKLDTLTLGRESVRIDG